MCYLFWKVDRDEREITAVQSKTMESPMGLKKMETIFKTPHYYTVLAVYCCKTWLLIYIYTNDFIKYKPSKSHHNSKRKCLMSNWNTCIQVLSIFTQELKKTKNTKASLKHSLIHVKQTKLGPKSQYSFFSTA